jgi:hypothetical protein
MQLQDDILAWYEIAISLPTAGVNQLIALVRSPTGGLDDNKPEETGKDPERTHGGEAEIMRWLLHVVLEVLKHFMDSGPSNGGG